jgi:hypothetical protein
MTTMLITWSGDDSFNSVDYALKKAMFERKYLESKQPPGIVKLLDDNRIRYMKTNDFRLRIAKVKSDRKEAVDTGLRRGHDTFFSFWVGTASDKRLLNR